MYGKHILLAKKYKIESFSIDPLISWYVSCPNCTKPYYPGTCTVPQ